MKLTDIKPLFENSEDNPFDEKVLPTEGPELIKILQRKERALRHKACKAKTIYVRSQCWSAFKALEKQIRKLQKEEAAKQLAIKQGGKTSSVQIPESQVPAKVRVGTRSFDNPYFYGDTAKYAGDPAFYPWTPQMLSIYNQLDNLLIKNGLEGFTTIYASIKPARNGSNLYNFAVIGAKGKFVWRKYDAGGGSGQNDVYCLSDKMQTSSFINLADSDPVRFALSIDHLK